MLEEDGTESKVTREPGALRACALASGNQFRQSRTSNDHVELPAVQQDTRKRRRVGPIECKRAGGSLP